MNKTAMTNFIAMLAAGETREAQRYLLHFPRADRTPASIRDVLASRVHHEVLEVFFRLAPWLASDEVDDTPERVRLALEEAGTDGLNLTELARTVRNVRPDVMAVVLDGLVESREVVFEREKTGGRIANRYRLEKFAGGIKAANEQDDPFADVSHRG